MIDCGFQILRSGGVRQPPFKLTSSIAAGSRILFAGDSITQGFFGAGIDTTYRWCAPFEASLTARFTAAGKTVPTLINTAISGQRSDALLAGINAQVISQTPDYVFMCIGTNDIAAGLSYETTRDTISSIISTTLGSLPNCKFYVMSLLLNGEKWPKGQNPGSPPLSGDGPWDLRNAAIYDGLRAYLSVSAQWIYLRDALFAWEAGNNLTNAQQGYLTTDQTHPTKQGTGLGPISGAELISTLVEASVTLAL